MGMAAVIYKKGAPDNFVWEEIKVGAPERGQVRLRSTAIGVNFADTYHRAGIPHPMIVSDPPVVLGFEGVGEITPGETHDNQLCSVLLSELRPQTMFLADRGYDADWIRAFASDQGAWANIPPKRNRKEAICFSPYLYRARNLVERFFNKIKQCRRIATRYDKLAANYLAFIKLASIRIWLHAYESAP